MARTYGFIIHDFSRNGVAMSLEGFSTPEDRDEAMYDVLMDLPCECSLNAERTEHLTH